MVGTFQRPEAIELLKTTQFDIVVIGGGITGAGVVLDAAARGLRAALIEKSDFASGTSSKSSKMVHGGLRYLQQGEVPLVYEALAERHRLLKHAPHLVKPLPFLIPLTGKGGVIPAKIARLLGAAMWGYDLTGGIRIGKRHQRLTKSEVLERFPTFPPERLVSGYLYFDAGADDARLVTAILRTAALHFGAVIANYVDAKGFGVDTDGRIDAVHASADGADFTIRTRLAINAAGVWSDEVIRSDTGQDPEGIRPAKGIHIVVPHHLIGVTTAAVVPVPGDRRSVFVVPQGDFCYIGTTDTDYSGSLEDPQCEPEDIDYLLKAINQSCTNTITRDDICGTWAGLRPLVKSEAGGRTADLSRGHRITETDHGLITITGGKLTTYRHMAEDTVDLAVKRLGRSRNAARCATKRLHLRGAEGYHHASEHLVRMGLNPAQALHLSNRYGGEAIVLGEMTIKDPSLREPLVDGLPYLRVEALFAIRHEMARTVSDVMERRTRALLYFAAAARAGGPAVAAMLAEELGWDDATKAASLSAFEASADRQILAVHRPLKSVSA